MDADRDDNQPAARHCIDMDVGHSRYSGRTVHAGLTEAATADHEAGQLVTTA